VPRCCAREHSGGCLRTRWNAFAAAIGTRCDARRRVGSVQERPEDLLRRQCVGLTPVHRPNARVNAVVGAHRAAAPGPTRCRASSPVRSGGRYSEGGGRGAARRRISPALAARLKAEEAKGWLRALVSDLGMKDPDRLRATVARAFGPLALTPCPEGYRVTGQIKARGIARSGGTQSVYHWLRGRDLVESRPARVRSPHEQLEAPRPSSLGRAEPPTACADAAVRRCGDPERPRSRRAASRERRYRSHGARRAREEGAWRNALPRTFAHGRVDGDRAAARSVQRPCVPADPP
jgi:hypothetical protein